MLCINWENNIANSIIIHEQISEISQLRFFGHMIIIWISEKVSQDWIKLIKQSKDWSNSYLRFLRLVYTKQFSQRFLLLRSDSDRCYVMIKVFIK